MPYDRTDKRFPKKQTQQRPNPFAHFVSKSPYKDMTLLIVEDDPDSWKTDIEYYQAKFGCNVLLAKSPSQAFTQIEMQRAMGKPIPVIICDTYLEPDQQDQQVDPVKRNNAFLLEKTKAFLKRLKQENPDMCILVHSGDSATKEAIEPLCHRFILKGGSLEQLEANIKGAFDKVLRGNPPTPPAPAR